VEVAVLYEPKVAIRLTRGGEPLSGTFHLAVEKRVRGAYYVTPMVRGPERPPGDAIRLSAGEGGVAVADERALKSLADALGQEVTVKLFLDGARVDALVDPGALGREAECGIRLERFKSADVCMAPQPALDLASCSEGARHAAEEAQRVRTKAEERCWISVDDPAAKQLAAVRDAAVKKAACEKLVPLLASEAVAATEAAERVARECGSVASEETKQFVRRTRLRATISDAFEKAKVGTSQDMRAFYDRYYELGDVRVEEIRKLALQKFGPPNPARFRAAQKSVSAMRSPNFTASLCDLRRDGTAIATVNITGRTALHVLGGFLLGTSDPLKRGIDAMAVSQQRVTATVKSLTGAKQVLFPFGGGCDFPHWYLNDRPWPPKDAAAKPQKGK
jgi:hypothetical protein